MKLPPQKSSSPVTQPRGSYSADTIPRPQKSSRNCRWSLFSWTDGHFQCTAKSQYGCIWIHTNTLSYGYYLHTFEETDSVIWTTMWIYSSNNADTGAKLFISCDAKKPLSETFAISETFYETLLVKYRWFAKKLVKNNWNHQIQRWKRYPQYYRQIELGCSLPALSALC